MEKVTLERRGNGIVILTINRPDKRNAVDYDVIRQLKRHIKEVENNEDDKLLVITGAGDKAFCSGGDLDIFHSLYTKEEAIEMLSSMGKVLYRLMMCKKPTVAFVNGAAIGGGCELATACDYRMASEDSYFSFVQGRLGITTGWGGATMLHEKLPHDQASALLQTTKKISADEAKRIGFVYEILKEDEDILVRLEQFLIPRLEVLTAYKEVARQKWKQVKVKKRMKKEIKRCSYLWESEEHHRAVKLAFCK